jgi:integrase
MGTKQVLRRGYVSQKAAAAALRAALAEVDKGQHVAPSKLTVGQYLTDQWLPALRVKPSTEASYKKNVRLHVIPHIGSVPLAGLTGQRLTTLYRKLETEGRADGEGGLSARTTRYIHTIVRRALRDAVEDGLISLNPADKARPPTAAQAASPEMKCWTALAVPGGPTPQLTAFLDWSERDEDDLFAAWQLLGWTGMRRGEVLALRWEDLDLGNGQLAVRRSAGLVKVKGAGESIVIGTPKGGKARVVDLDDRSVEVLRRHRRTLAGIGLDLARDGALVLPRLTGGAFGTVLHPERFSRSFATRLVRARAALGEDALPVIRVHDLRHTHATALLLNGTPVHVVSQRLGHASPDITLRVYAHVLPTVQRAHVNALAARAGGLS